MIAGVTVLSSCLNRFLLYCADNQSIMNGAPLILWASTYRKTMAWFSPLAPRRVKARLAKSSASAMALPSFPPSGPLVDVV